MEVRVDESQFDTLQTQVAHAVAHEIYTALKLSGAPDSAELEEIVAKALFRVGAVLDGSHVLEGPSGPTEAVLMFRTEDDRTTLISSGGGSWIHEGAFGVAEEYFDRLRPRRERPRREADERRLNLLDLVPTRWFRGRPKA